MTAIADHAEERVLGAILTAGSLGVGPRALGQARAAGLEPDQFYRASLGELYRVMIEMTAAGIDSLSPLSVAGELERRGREAAGALDELTGGVDSSRLLGLLEVLAQEPRAFVTQVARLAELVRVDAERRRMSSSGPAPGAAGASGPGREEDRAA